MAQVRGLADVAAVEPEPRPLHEHLPPRAEPARSWGPALYAPSSERNETLIILPFSLSFSFSLLLSLSVSPFLSFSFPYNSLSSFLSSSSPFSLK